MEKSIYLNKKKAVKLDAGDKESTEAKSQQMQEKVKWRALSFREIIDTFSKA